MADYTELDVTGWTAERLVTLINQRLARYPSVQLFKRGSKLILRTWRVEFELCDDDGS
jgi:hypothetical protein